MTGAVDDEPATQLDDPTPSEPMHVTSMAVWGMPSVAIAGRAATVKIGVTCCFGCSLAGNRVAVLDESGKILGEALLLDDPDGVSKELSWAQVAFKAPATMGVSQLSASFSANDGEVTHLTCRAAFSVMTDRAPDASISLQVIFAPTGKVLEEVEVRLGRYFAYTDKHGRARVNVPKGKYLCEIRKEGFAAAPFNIAVNADASLLIKAEKGETREELEARLSAMENYPWG
jgi:hypothetical protein